MKIAVVEDEVSIRNGLAKMLPKINARYQLAGTAADGREGLDMILRTRPDLVIADIQMPEMNGLDMLASLREKGVACHAVILTAYSDFSYAQRAIALDIDTYLLKPIKLQELKQTLETIQEAVDREQGTEKLQERLLSLEQIFRACVMAELPVDEELNRVTSQQYGLDTGESLGLFSIWLGEDYQECAGDAVHLMEVYTGRVVEYSSVIISSNRFSLVLVILYHVKDMERIQDRYRTTVVPALMRGLKHPAVFGWMVCGGMQNLPEAFAQMMANRRWNLSVPAGTMIDQELLSQIQPVPFKYPMELENVMTRMVTERNQAGFQKGIRSLIQMCTVGKYDPYEIRESCVRLCLVILTTAHSLGRLSVSGVSAQTLLGGISSALSWEEIRKNMDQLYNAAAAQRADEEISGMVRRAKRLIEEYYTQGITLEEVAQKLCVSEEYLSTQFKKETGTTFTETVRRYRIDRIKALLLHSTLKLNQIADIVGYSDPKYMSRVFKEEVGMLPAEFRKNNLL